MADIVEIENNIDEIKDEQDDGLLTKTKIKKPRTTKKIEAFKEVIEKRKQNIALRKDEKLIKSAQLLVDNSKKQKQVVLPVVPPVESESEDEQIIIVKSKKAKTKKKIIKRRVIIESSSSSESDNGSSGSSSGGEMIRKYKSNKSNKNKVVIQREQPVNETYKNYFV